MEILFRNITKYTDTEMNRFQKFHKNKNQSKYMVWKTSVFILFICFFILNILCHNWCAAIGTILLALILYKYYFNMKPNKKRENNKKQLEQEFTFNFFNNYLEIKAIKVNNKIPYYKFHRVYETKDNFYLYLDDEYSVLINKNGFVIGSTEEFRKFIKKKLIFKYRLEK